MLDRASVGDILAREPVIALIGPEASCVFDPGAVVTGSASLFAEVLLRDDAQRHFVAAGRILYRSLVAIAEFNADHAHGMCNALRDAVPYGPNGRLRSHRARVDEIA